jgi:parallel beta-helix repeat protein
MNIQMKNNFFLSTYITGVFILLCTLLSTAQTVYTVTDSTDGSTPGKLRYVIDQVNLNSGPSIIKFNIPSAGTDPINFVLSTIKLPTILKTVTIDGTTQPGYSIGNSRIRIVGLDPPTAAFQYGIAFSNAQGSKLLAIQLSGFITGVSIQSSNYCEIRNCMINRCSDKNIEILSSSYCILKGNTLNTDKTGTNLYASTPSLNASKGIYFTNAGSVGSSNNIIGGQACDEGNTIAYVKSEGIDNATLAPASAVLNIGNRFSGNKIYGNTTNDAISLRATANNNLQPPVITQPANCVLSGTTSPAVPFGIIEVFSGVTGAVIGDKKAALQFLASTTANASGAWSVAIGVSPTDRVTATVTDPLTNNTSELAGAVSIIQSYLKLNHPVGIIITTKCLGSEFKFTTVDSAICAPQRLFDYGDGTSLTSNPNHSYGSQGFFNIVAYAYSQSGCAEMHSTHITVKVIAPCPPPCTDCIGSFAPEGGKYVITGWAKKETAPPTDTTYLTPRLQITFPTSTTGSFYSFAPSGRIIDGWQRIEGEFTVPTTGVTDIKINLKCLGGSGNCLFDDIRVFPTDGSMKSYVYDPISMKLVAELDERNYSTFYEYDEEGKLVRVKKETEKGIMTIKENRDNTNKR